MNSQDFPAPWGKTLRWISTLSTILILAVLVPVIKKSTTEPVRWLVVLPLLLLPGAGLFVIRSYAIEPNALVIRRLLWATRLPLAGLQSAVYQPNAMRGSLRLFGNGGLFSISGWYRNRALGFYRAFVTELKNTVVLRFPKRTVVVSPEDPQRFVAEISRFAFPTP